MNRILIIGATGFTGRRVLKYLEDHGPVESAYTLLVRDPAKAPKGYDTLYADLDDMDSIIPALKEADGLICLASLGFGHGPKLVKACEQYGVKRALFISTTGIYTKLNPKSKFIRLEAEKAIKNSLLDWTIIRPTMIYGRHGDRNMERLVKYIKRFPILFAPWGSLGAFHQPVHVDDLAKAIIDAFYASGTYRQAYNISGEKPIKFSYVIKTVARHLHRRVLVVPVPLWPMRLLLRLYEKISYSPALKEEQLLRLVEDKAFDHALAERDFRYEPRSFEDGIKVLVRDLYNGPSFRP